MARILVTGASGLLGANFVLHAVDLGHEVIAISRARAVTAEGVETAHADLSAPGEARRLVEAIRPNWVVHCAALTDLDRCECEPELALNLNSEMAEMVAHASRSVGARLVHVSTDAVFDGRRGDYTEADNPSPINVYGRTKLAGERAVMEADPGALIVRTNFFGWSAHAGQGLAEWFLTEMGEGRECPGFADVSFSPLLVNQLCDLLLRMLQLGFYGLYHLPGADCVTKHDFGVRLARAFGFDPSLILKASVKRARLAAPRGERLCLRADRMVEALGETPPSLDAGLSRFREMHDSDYVTRLRAAARSQSS
jgi:dTDP-4-dehydrorhamnose reductase